MRRLSISRKPSSKRQRSIADISSTPKRRVGSSIDIQEIFSPVRLDREQTSIWRPSYLRNRFPSYRLDAVKLLDSRVKEFMGKHFKIWKNSETVLVPRERRSLQVSTRNFVFAPKKSMPFTFGEVRKSRRSPTYFDLNSVNTDQSPEPLGLERQRPTRVPRRTYSHLSNAEENITPQVDRARSKLYEIRENRHRRKNSLVCNKAENFVRIVENIRGNVCNRTKKDVFKRFKNEELSQGIKLVNMVKVCREQQIIKDTMVKIKALSFVASNKKDPLTKIKALLVREYFKRWSAAYTEEKTMTVQSALQVLVNRKTKMLFRQYRNILNYSSVLAYSKSIRIVKGIRRLTRYRKQSLKNSLFKWKKHVLVFRSVATKVSAFVKVFKSTVDRERALLLQDFWWRAIIHVKTKRQALNKLYRVIHSNIQDKFNRFVLSHLLNNN